MSHGNAMICQPVALSGYAEWPKVADAMIEALFFSANSGENNYFNRFSLTGNVTPA